MAIKYVKAEKQAIQYYFQVNLDDSKQDSSLIKEFTFPVVTPDGQSSEEYLNQIKADLSVLIRYEVYQGEIAQAAIPHTIPGFLD